MWPTTHHWEHEGHAYVVLLHWVRMRGARLECNKVDIEARPFRPITAKVLRAVPLGRFVEEGREEAFASASAIAERDPKNRTAAYLAKAHVLPPPDQYRHLRVAVAYSRAWEGGDSGPVKAVMRELGVRGRSTAGRYVQLAREAGYLEPTEVGQPNGALTPLAAELLDRYGDDWDAWDAEYQRRSEEA